MPEAKFVKDKKLRKLFREVRHFINEENLEGNPAGTTPKMIKTPPLVEMSRQLFFYAVHLKVVLEVRIQAELKRK